MFSRIIQMPFRIRRGRTAFSVYGPREVLLLAVAALQAGWWVLLADLGLDFAARALIGGAIGFGLATLALIPVRGYKAEVFVFKMLRWRLGSRHYRHQTAVRDRARESAPHPAARDINVAKPAAAKSVTRPPLRLSLGALSLPSVIDALMALFLTVLMLGALAVALSRGGLL